jgi:2'-5' RNA ligase
MVRCFVGILIPEELKNSVVSLQKRLETLPMGCKFVERENLHLSVSFLGEVEEAKLEEITKKLDAVCARFKKFTAVVSDLKVIPSESYIRVLALSVYDDADSLVEIGNAIRKEVGGDVKPPHLTLCRVKSIENKKNIIVELENYKNFEIGKFTVSKINLIKSDLERSGPVYTTIHESFLSD